MQSYITVMIDDKNFPIPCPSHECKTPMSEPDLKFFCSMRLFAKYNTFKFDLYIEKNSDIFQPCITPD